jgi:hypothetical protein
MNDAPANGPAWAALLAAGIGCGVFGVIVDLAEVFKPVSKKLNLYNPTGDLSGKTSVAILVWLIAWVLLHLRWKNRTIYASRTISLVTFILVVAGLIAIFPPFVELLTKK